MKTFVIACTVDIDIVVCREHKFQAHVHSSNLILTDVLANVVVCDTRNSIYGSNALHRDYRNELKKVVTQNLASINCLHIVSTIAYS